MPRFVVHPGLGLAAMSLSLSAMLVAATVQAQQTQKPSAKSRSSVQKGEGVILRVETAAGGESSKPKGDATRVTITVNTAVVWRDYTRDTANLSKTPDAKNGENSVATKGQPDSPVNEINAEVGPDTPILLRYRSSTDDVTDGSRSVEKAKKPGLPPASDDKDKDKAPKMKISDLKPGLYVEIEAKDGKASKVTVLKPVGGPETPASEAAPSDTKTGK